MTCYCISWSPRQGEATYSRSFNTAAERDQFAARIVPIAANPPHIWENRIPDAEKLRRISDAKDRAADAIENRNAVEYLTALKDLAHLDRNFAELINNAAYIAHSFNHEVINKAIETIEGKEAPANE